MSAAAPYMLSMCALEVVPAFRKAPADVAGAEGTTAAEQESPIADCGAVSAAERDEGKASEL